MGLLSWILNRSRRSQAIALTKSTIETIARSDLINYGFDATSISTMLVDNNRRCFPVVFDGRTGLVPSCKPTVIASFASGLALFDRNGDIGSAIVKCLSHLLSTLEKDRGIWNALDQILLDISRLELAKIVMPYDPFEIDIRKRESLNYSADAGFRKGRESCIEAIHRSARGDALMAVHEAEVALKESLSAVHFALYGKIPDSLEDEFNRAFDSNVDVMLLRLKPYIKSIGVDCELWFSIASTIKKYEEKDVFTAVEGIGFGLLVQRWGEEISRLYDRHVKLAEGVASDAKTEDCSTSNNAPRVTFSSLGGMCEVQCNDCKERWTVVSFLHGHGPERDCDTGYQCQACGKFKTLHNELSSAIDGGCECGGCLSHESELFCPHCKSKNIESDMPFFCT